MSFSLLNTDTYTDARRGELKTAHGIVETPVFMPVGTQATVKTMTAQELEEMGVIEFEQEGRSKRPVFGYDEIDIQISL